MFNDDIGSIPRAIRRADGYRLPVLLTIRGGETPCGMMGQSSFSLLAPNPCLYPLLSLCGTGTLARLGRCIRSLKDLARAILRESGTFMFIAMKRRYSVSLLLLMLATEPGNPVA